MEVEDATEFEENIDYRATINNFDRTGDSLIEPPTFPSAMSIPMWSFISGSSRVVPNKAVKVDITPTPGGFIAECETLNVFAAGSSMKECQDDLQDQVVYFYKRYTALSEDDVVGLAAVLRNIYLSNFSTV